MAETPEQRQARVLAAQNKQKNIAPAVSNMPDSSGFNIGGNLLQTAQLVSALKGAPAAPATTPVTTMPGALPVDPTTPVTPGAPSYAVNMPAPTLTPAPPQTIMGMQPEQFAAMAGMLGSALAPNEYGPTGQLVPSALGNVGNLAGQWGISQMLRKQGGGNIAPGGK